MDNVAIPQLLDDESLYHYTTAQAVQRIIENNEMWVTRSDFLNDKSEMKYIDEIIQEVCDEAIEDKRASKIFGQGVIGLMKDLDTNPMTGDKVKYYILSFSLEPDSLTLWSEFSGLKGYNIELEANGLYENICRYNHKLQVEKGKVIYNRSEQKGLLLRALSHIVERVKGQDINCIMTNYMNTEKDTLPIINLEYLNNRVKGSKEIVDFGLIVFDFACMCILYSMFFKKPCFQQEREYRMIMSEVASKEAKVKSEFRCKGEIFLPYIRVKLEEDKKTLPIKSVRIAPINSMDLAMKGMNVFLRERGYNIDVIPSDIPLRY